MMKLVEQTNLHFIVIRKARETGQIVTAMLTVAMRKPKLIVKVWDPALPLLSLSHSFIIISMFFCLFLFFPALLALPALPLLALPLLALLALPLLALPALPLPALPALPLPAVLALPALPLPAFPLPALIPDR